METWQTEFEDGGNEVETHSDSNNKGSVLAPKVENPFVERKRAGARCKSDGYDGLIARAKRTHTEKEDCAYCTRNHLAPKAANLTVERKLSARCRTVFLSLIAAIISWFQWSFDIGVALLIVMVVVVVVVFGAGMAIGFVAGMVIMKKSSRKRSVTLQGDNGSSYDEGNDYEGNTGEFISSSYGEAYYNDDDTGYVYEDNTTGEFFGSSYDEGNEDEGKTGEYFKFKPPVLKGDPPVLKGETSTTTITDTFTSVAK